MKKYFLILLLVFLPVIIAFAQVQEPPEITEYQVYKDVEYEILPNLCPSLCVSTTEPDNVLYMSNAKVSLTNGLLILSADYFKESVGLDKIFYKNFLLSGTLSVSNGQLVFSLNQLQPSNFPSDLSSGIVREIDEALNTYIDPSSGVVIGWEHDPKNLKCVEIQENKLMLIYDKKGASNYVPHPYEFCAPISQGGMLQYGTGGYNGGSGSNGGNTNTNTLHITTPLPEDLSTKGLGLTAACPKTGCGFNELLEMVNKVVKFIIFDLAIPVAAIMFAYAGIILLISGGDPSKKTKAKEIFLGVVIGLVVAAAAWLIIETILKTLGYDGSWIGF